MSQLKSKCCNADVTILWDEENFYKCKKCGKINREVKREVKR